MQTFTVEGRFPSLNDIISASKKGRGKYQPYSKMKQEYTELVQWHCKSLKPVLKPVIVAFKWCEPNNKRDVDNISVGQKFILDGLVKAGILENDSQKFVVGLEHSFAVDKNKPRVEVIIKEME